MPGGAEPAAMVCRCGKTLKLTGARPGRVGRCPGCGATFRVPEPAPAPNPSPPPRAPAPPAGRAPDPKPKPKAGPTAPRRREVWEGDEHEDPGPPGGYGLAPEGPRRPEANRAADDQAVLPERVAARDSGRVPIEPVGRAGLVRLPARPERNPAVSLLYPLWDATGLTWLTLLTPVLTVVTLCVFGLIPIVLGGGDMAILLPFAFAMIVPFGFGVAYVLAIFADVLVESSRGEASHPRWPDINLGTLFLSLVRWGVALGIGCGPFALAALTYWRGRPDPGVADRLLVALLISAGGLYSLMAVLSIYLHDDLLAAKPSMVLGGAFRVGRGYLVAVLAMAGSVVLGTLIVSGIYRLGSLAALFFATWGAWVFAVYAGLVVMRLLGLAYHRRAKRVGWFETTRRPKDVPYERTPAPVTDL